MIDPKIIRKDPDHVKKALADRGENPKTLEEFIDLDKKWRDAQSHVEQLLADRKKVSAEVAKQKRSGGDSKEWMEKGRKIADEIKKYEEGARELEEKSKDLLLRIPNISHSSVPKGKDDSQNKEIRQSGSPPNISGKEKPHWEIGTQLGILDFEAAAKISGSRFVVYRGVGAALARALTTFMLDVHIKENGYTEIYPPFLVNAESAMGTGQLPKFEQDLFKAGEHYLVPTAEVPVTNLHRKEILSVDKLPISYTAYTACFRSEAGSYGKDVRGLIRQHQFDKVELVKFTEPEKSYDALEELTKHAESILQKLGLHYRVVELCTGDIGFSAAKTYDLEVWFPAEGKFREISSCSNFEDFQARRAQIRFRRDAKSKPELVHTLNGSGVAVGRTFAAILENFQQPDGSVLIPEVLRPYLGGLEKITA